MICVHKELLGLDSHLIYDGDKYMFSRDVPVKSWVLGAPSRQNTRGFSTILECLKCEISAFPPEQYIKAWSEIRGKGTKNIRWHMALPEHVFQKQLSEALGQLWLILKDPDNSYYFNELRVERELTQTMSRATVSIKKIKSILKQEDEIKTRSLKKFVPEDDTLAPKTIYSHSSSVTGRLSVSDGPNILTLNKKYRKIFESRHGKEGAVIQIDLVSLEPRIALMISEKEAPVDIYDTIMKDVLNGSATREDTKIATLGCLYGMSHFTLDKKISNSLNSKDILEKVRRYFCIKKIESRLQDEVNKKGFIVNFYGRKIFSQEALVNHFIQSTGVDVSLLCFSSLLLDLKNHGVKLDPIYIIHDALVLDIKNEDINTIDRLVKKGLTAPGFNQKFYAKCSKFNEV